MFYMLQQQETIYSLFGFLAIRMRQNQVALAYGDTGGDYNANDEYSAFTLIYLTFALKY